jgi:hypothetical protein
VCWNLSTAVGNGWNPNYPTWPHALQSSRCVQSGGVRRGGIYGEKNCL